MLMYEIKRSEGESTVTELDPASYYANPDNKHRLVVHCDSFMFVEEEADLEFDAKQSGTILGDYIRSRGFFGRDTDYVIDRVFARYPHDAITYDNVRRECDYVQIARIVTYERLSDAILHRIPDALRSEGCQGLEDALGQASCALKEWRALS